MAKSTKLYQLHNAFAEYLKGVLENGEVVQFKGETFKVSPTSGTLKEIREFLKDNEITGIAVDGSPLGELASTPLKSLPFQESEDVASLVVSDRDEIEF